MLWVIGVVGVLAAIALGLFVDHSSKRFFFSYLTGFMFVLAIALGGLFFTMVQHLVKAAWSVNVRRVAEWLAAAMPVVGILSAPLVVPVLLHQSPIFVFAGAEKPAELAEKPEISGEKAAVELNKTAPTEGAKAEVTKSENPAVEAKGKAEKGETHEEMHGFKAVYLNPVFWTVRVIFYFVVWSIIGILFWKKSLEQDKTGSLDITNYLQRISPVCTIIYAFTLTGASFDFLMALDPEWSSTIFGVYYFAECVLAVMATIVIVVTLLQRAGYLTESVTSEHFHDLGKFLFAFTFFWGYIAFSQYMLQWYANLPEETLWYRHHGATQAQGSITPWTYVVIALLFGHLLIPFAGLLSRHVKRNKYSLMFWAIWQLVFIWVDLYWIVMPQLDYNFHFGLIDIVAPIGLAGVYFAFVMSRAKQGSLRPLQDPRLEASLQFQNI